MSTSQRSLREDRPVDRRPGEARHAPSSKPTKPGPLSEEMQMKHSLNGSLSELNSMYQAKLEILKNPFYDKDNLENSLQRFILSDCIEYKEFGIEAYEILSMHEKLLEVTLAEKKLRHDLELKDNLRALPLLHEDAQNKKKELRELGLILDRQQSVASADQIILKNSALDPLAAERMHLTLLEDSPPLGRSVTLKQSAQPKPAGARQSQEAKQYSDLGGSAKPNASAVRSKPFGYTQQLAQIPEFALQAQRAR